MTSIVIEREEIYAQIWSEPATHVAKRLGVSWPALARACDQLSVPRPPSGHWARVALDATPERVPLPKLSPGTPTSCEIKPPSPRSVHLAKGRAEPPIVVPENVKQLHPLLSDRGEKAKGALVAIQVTKELRDRAVRVMHTILTEFDRRRFPYKPMASDRERGTRRRGRVEVVIDGIELSIVLSEWIRPTVLPPAPGSTWNRHENRGDGRLRLHVYTSNWNKAQRYWRDEGARRVEHHLNAFFAGLHTAADHERRRRAEWEVAAREWRAVEEARRREAEHAEHFKKIVADARERVADFIFVTQLRELADRVGCTDTPRAVGWSVWARNLATRWEHEIVSEVPDVSFALRTTPAT